MAQTTALPHAPPDQPTMLLTLDRARQYARLPEDILLVGPTGSGKGHLARQIHEWSGRRGDFVSVTGGQLSDTLWSSQLFGHLAGAFTDAKRNALGAFEQAANGTLFLDELHHWSPVVQSALLHPLENRRFRPLGAERELIATCRFVFATTIPPTELVEKRGFLPDLRHRLPALVLQLLPLASRRAEILPLFDRFAETVTSAYGWDLQRFRLDHSAVRTILLSPWEGNIRELYNVVKRLIANVGPFPERPISGGDLDLPAPPTGALRGLVGPAVFDHLVDWAIRYTRGSRQKAAALLGVHRNTLPGYLRQLSAATSDAQSKASDEAPPRRAMGSYSA